MYLFISFCFFEVKKPTIFTDVSVTNRRIHRNDAIVYASIKLSIIKIENSLFFMFTDK